MGHCLIAIQRAEWLYEWPSLQVQLIQSGCKRKHKTLNYIILVFMVTKAVRLSYKEDKGVRDVGCESVNVDKPGRPETLQTGVEGPQLTCPRCLSSF